MVNKNSFLVDWFSASCRLEEGQDWRDLLQIIGCTSEEFNDMKEGYGHHGYMRSYSLDGLFIYCDHYDDDRKFWVEMSGKGCRLFDTLSEKSFSDLFKMCIDPLDDPFFNVRRIDIAYDMFDDPFMFDNVKNALQSGLVVSRFQEYEIEERRALRGGVSVSEFLGRTIYLGSQHSSDLFCRLYDKRLERRRDDVFSWYRWEMVFRRDKALEFCMNYVTFGTPIGFVFKSYLNEYVRICDYDRTDSNYRRWSTAKWWDRFVASSGKLKELEKKTTEYNLLGVQDYVQNQAGNSIDVLLQTVGEEKTLKLVRDRMQRLNYRQLDVIREYKLKNGDKNES